MNTWYRGWRGAAERREGWGEGQEAAGFAGKDVGDRAGRALGFQECELGTKVIALQYLGAPREEAGFMEFSLCQR